MSRFPPGPPDVLGQVRAQGPPVRQPRKAAATGKGNPWLGGTIGEAAAAATRTSTFLAARHKRIVRRRGRNAP